MMHSSWLRALAVTVGLVAGGCTVHGSAHVRAPEPPPPRVVHVETRPGYVWVNGYWDYVGGHWLWRDGYWEPERYGHVYIQGRWDNGSRRYVRGYWQPARPGHVWVPGAYVTVRGRAQWREGRWERADRRDRVIDRRSDSRPRVIDRR